MSARPLFEDDDVLFEDPTSDRASHVELRVDGRSYEDRDESATQPEIPPAANHLARVPRVAMKSRELSLLPLDHREGFLLSMIDGRTSIETILDVCAMPADEALQLLEGLADRGVIVIPR
jgi:hypothetical protein